MAVLSVSLSAQAQQPDWNAFDEETMRHFQTLLRFDTTDPPGNEKPAADYLKQVFEKEGIPVKVFALEPNRRLVYATLSGLPIVDYVGEVDLEPAPDGGTVIRWHSSFFPKVLGTGWILQRGLRRFLERCVHGLAEYAPVANDQESMRPAK